MTWVTEMPPWFWVTVGMLGSFVLGVLVGMGLGRYIKE